MIWYIVSYRGWYCIIFSSCSIQDGTVLTVQYWSSIEGEIAVEYCRLWRQTVTQITYPKSYCESSTTDNMFENQWVIFEILLYCTVLYRTRVASITCVVNTVFLKNKNKYVWREISDVTCLPRKLVSSKFDVVKYIQYCTVQYTTDTVVLSTPRGGVWYSVILWESRVSGWNLC